MSPPSVPEERATGEGWANFLVYPSAFNGVECDRLTALGDSALRGSGAQQGAIEGLENAGELRDSRVGWVPRGEHSEWAFARLESIALSANELWGLDVEGIIEELQYTLYDQPGSHYTWHHDGLDSGVDDRKVSLVVQLSASGEYQGADLQFLEVAADYDEGELSEYLELTRRRGTVIAFCAFEYHRVTPLVAGLRRSLVAWVAGPRLR